MHAYLRSTLRFFVLPVGVAAPLAIVGCGGESTGQVDTVVDTFAAETAVETTVATPETTVTTPETVGCPLDQACDDQDSCTTNDRCNAAGVCAGVALDCDDDLACTTDSCTGGTCAHVALNGFCITEGATPACIATGNADPGNGCRVCSLGTGGGAAFTTLANGATCSDSNACTTQDTCQAGACTGGPALVCTTDGPCNAAGCDPAHGCTLTATTAPCEDGDPCTTGDVCAAGHCQTGSGQLSCDDQDPCTDDSCEAGVGCGYEAHCDDGNPCTNDSCDAAGACGNVLFTGPCDDADPCTTGETCDAAGVCGSGADVDCDDTNACTTDACISHLGGCLHLFKAPVCNEAGCVPFGCDDGIACTSGDQCVAGVCFGGKLGSTDPDLRCDICELAPTTLANKIISLELAADGSAGSGLDIDDDPSTCAPESLGCSGGVDNALAPLAGVMNPGVSDSIELGAVKWIIDLRNQRVDGQPFHIEVYDSRVLLDAFGNSCDYQADTCDYEIAQLSFDPACRAYFRLDNVRITGNKITGGGDDQLIRMVLPLKGGAALGVTIASARFEGEVALDAQGKIKSMNAIVGGAIPKDQLLQAINDLDPSALPVDKATATALINEIIVNDTDLDFDGLDEAASVAMRIRTIKAVIAQTEGVF